VWCYNAVPNRKTVRSCGQVPMCIAQIREYVSQLLQEWNCLDLINFTIENHFSLKFKLSCPVKKYHPYDFKEPKVINPNIY
jgi:hypothetical protein